MRTRRDRRVRLFGALLVGLLLLSGCGASPAHPAAPVPPALPATLPPPTGIWLPTRTPLPPTPTEPPRPPPTPTRPPPTRTPRPPIPHATFTPPAAGQPLIGAWGDAYINPMSDPIRLTANATGGGIRFYCNHGNFPPLVVDAQGHFDVVGTYVREQAFPEPETPAPVATRYQGYVAGSTLVLTMTMLYPQPDIIPYKLPFVSMDPPRAEWPPCT